MDFCRIARAMKDAGKQTIVIFGDYCLDKYLYTDPAKDEISVETGLVARQFDHKEIYAGAGGTIANNLRALGVQVRCIGLLGQDGEGWELESALRQIGAATRWMVETPGRCTCTYMKPMQKKPGGGYTETERLDFRCFSPVPRRYEDALLKNLKEALEDADAVIIADQFAEENSGALTPRVREAVCELACSRQDKLFYVDSRAFVWKYRYVMVKCNQHEVVRACCADPAKALDLEFVRECGLRLAAHAKKPAFVTLGAKGSLVFTDKVEEVPAFQEGRWTS